MKECAKKAEGESETKAGYFSILPILILEFRAGNSGSLLRD
jgi:hypothetical protein